jgi:hypothetical protein
MIETLITGPLRGGDRDSGAPTINARNVNGGPLGGDDEDPRVPTINVRNIDSGPPDPWGVGLHPGPKRCDVNLHRYER